MQLLKYKHLSLEQRYQISALWSSGMKISAIADQIGCNKSTISRELKRNVAQRGQLAKIYDPTRAQAKADERQKKKNKHRVWEEWMIKYMRNKLRDDRWSPELISAEGRAKFGHFVSHETCLLYTSPSPRDS